MIFATGCASERIQARPAPDFETAASLNFYRNSQFLYSGQPAIVAVDGIESASMPTHSKSSILVSPGEHTFAIRSANLGEKQLETKVNVQPGQAVYYEIYPNPNPIIFLFPIAMFARSPFLIQVIDESSFRIKSDGYDEQKVQYSKPNNISQHDNSPDVGLSSP
jgi:hypothetical protein